MTDTLLEQLQRVNSENGQLKADASARDAWELTHKEMLSLIGGETLGEKIQGLVNVTIELMLKSDDETKRNFGQTWDWMRKNQLA